MMFFKNLYNSYLAFCEQKRYREKRNELSSMRIYMSEACNANCNYCFNKTIRKDSHMDRSKALLLFDYLHINGIKSLKIMGGEPTIHPNFKELYKEAQLRFNNVALFTNALNDMVLNITPRKDDSVIYNFVFINDNFLYDKLLPQNNSGFPRVFEIVIDHSTNMDALKDKIDMVADKCNQLGVLSFCFQLTINCMVNIFAYRDSINNKMKSLLIFLLNKYPKHYSFDHTVPLCFWDDEVISFMESNGIDYFKKTCRGKDFGLIDANLNLLHCNQYPVVLTSMIKNGHFISFDRVMDLLKESNEGKKERNFYKMCSTCKYFPKQCTGGCMIHKDFIKK